MRPEHTLHVVSPSRRWTSGWQTLQDDAIDALGDTEEALTRIGVPAQDARAFCRAAIPEFLERMAERSGDKSVQAIYDVVDDFLKIERENPYRDRLPR